VAAQPEKTSNGPLCLAPSATPTGRIGTTFASMRLTPTNIFLRTIPVLLPAAAAHAPVGVPEQQ
jgi:hypothetical protein